MYGIDYNKNRLQDSYLSDHINSDNTFGIYGGELIAFVGVFVVNLEVSIGTVVSGAVVAGS